MNRINMTKRLSSCFDYFKRFDLSEKLIRRNKLYYTNAQALLTSLQQKELAERKNAINALLCKTLKIKTPHLIEFKAIKHGMKGLPLIDKHKIQKSPKSFLGPLGKISITSATSGSTGVPLTLYRSFPSIVFEQAAIDSIYRTNGIDPLLSKIAVLRGDTIKNANDRQAPYWKYNANGRILKLSSHHLNTDTLNNYLDELEHFSPDVIYAYPSAIEFLSYLIANSGRKFTIPLIVTSSEVFSTKSRDKVTATLGCSICDYYGQAERISFAYSNKVDEYYFLPGYSFIELEYKYRDKEQDYYEVIGTSLWNKAMPIQRYKTGDLAVLPQGLGLDDLEKICYGIKPFKGILGRTSEYLLSPTGQRLIGINQIPKFINNVARMQFVQNTQDNVNIYVIPEKNYTASNEAEIFKSARKKIPKSINIKIILTDTLQKNKNQKIPLVIRNI